MVLLRLKEDDIEDIPPPNDIYFRLSPSLGDGKHISITEFDKDGLLSLIDLWLDEFAEIPDSSFTVDIVKISKEDYEKIPEE